MTEKIKFVFICLKKMKKIFFKKRVSLIVQIYAIMN